MDKKNETYIILCPFAYIYFSEIKPHFHREIHEIILFSKIIFFLSHNEHEISH